MKNDAKPAVPRINISSTSTPQKREIDGEERPRSRPRAQETPEAWEDKQLGHIFRMTLKPEAVKDIHGHELYLVEGVRQDLLEANESLLLKTTLLDQALTEVAAKAGGNKPLNYLLACWKRVSRAVRSFRGADTHPERLDVLKEAKRLCLSYCFFSVAMPEMFGAETTLENPLAQHLLEDPESDKGIDVDFLAEAVSRFEEDDMVSEALVGAAVQLSRWLAGMSMTGAERPYVTALRNLLRYPLLVIAISRSPTFLPSDVAAQDIEKITLLGPFFKLSPLQSEVAMNYFSNGRGKDRGYVNNAHKSLRMTLQTHQEELFQITDAFVRASKDSRERILDWIAHSLNANHKRRAMRPDPKAVSSDGFMINITVVLDRLCDPFMDASFTKIDRIDVNYLRRNPRVSIQDETKINADQKTSDALYAETVSGSNNFISEVFFLAVAAHHYGLEAASAQLINKEKMVKQMEKDLTAFESERHKYMGVSVSLHVYCRKMDSAN